MRITRAHGNFLNFYLHNVGGPFLLQCNYDTASFAKNIPKIYTECLKEWEIHQQKQVSASSHILDQIIWNNKFIKIGGRSLYRCALVNKGIVRVKDILDRANYTNGMCLKTAISHKLNISS